MRSCIYEGFVTHRRFSPVSNEFRYSVFQMYLDLAELPTVFETSRLWSARRPAVAWFRRADHLGPVDEPLDVSVRNEVERQTGVRPTGPICLLTNLRYFGYVMNPVSYFYCFNEASGSLESVLAQVQNTPWGERHCYVLTAPTDCQNGRPKVLWSNKEFHVSPFMPMNMRYRWQISQPGERLAVHIENHFRVDSTTEDVSSQINAEIPRSPFDVTLSLQRKEISAAALRRILFYYPCMTAKVTMAIYWQALKLWWKRVPFIPHPSRTDRQTGESSEKHCVLHTSTQSIHGSR